MFIPPSGLYYGEYYLYSDKQWVMAPSGVSTCLLASGVMQNAPVIITSSGYIETQPQDAFARYDGQRKYNKVGYGNFSLLENGYPDPTSREFALHPNASGMVVFATTLKENVFIEYEAGISSYYTLTSVDLNPMRNQFKSGFISFSNETVPVSIDISATNTELTSDGAQKTNIIATMLDANNDACPNQDLIFSIADAFISYLTPIDNGVVTGVDASGTVIGITNITNSKGQARVSYWPIEGQSGAQVVTASWGQNRNIFGYVVITQAYTLGNPFVLDVSALDSADYLT